MSAPKARIRPLPRTLTSSEIRGCRADRLMVAICAPWAPEATVTVRAGSLIRTATIGLSAAGIGTLDLGALAAATEHTVAVRAGAVDLGR